MDEDNKLKFLIHLRWYSAVNYIVALGEQVTLYHYKFMTFFWIALTLNILTIITLSLKVSKLEKELSID